MLSGQNFKIFKDGRISRPAWMGLKASVDIRNQIMEAISKPGSDLAREMFEGIDLIPYTPHRATAIIDSSNYMFFFRSQLTSDMILDLLPKANSTAIDFVRAIKKPFTEGDMLTHSRGDHWFSIAGHDRNNKEVSNKIQ
ncbi:hypothetical protein F5880DRAFT_1492980 [Lentinula raphanica]|nr:hypothetical protein F5880DRAFT_1492980 [Lentinula raphanica]